MLLFLCNVPATTEIYTLSLHDALPICFAVCASAGRGDQREERCAAPSSSGHAHASPSPSPSPSPPRTRSEEHTSELQSHSDLVCRLLLEKKKKKFQLNNCKICPT